MDFLLQYFESIVLAALCLGIIAAGPFGLGYYLGKRVFSRLPKWSNYLPSLVAATAILWYTISHIPSNATSLDVGVRFLLCSFPLFMVIFFSCGIQHAGQTSRRGSTPRQMD